MSSTSPVPPPQPLTVTHWLILVIASIGFAFDIYELLMLPLILPDALRELLPGVAPGSDAFNWWRAMMFWVPAMAGGFFGLVGGYLTDYLGRRRVLTWSILLYAFSAFFAGFSTSMPMLIVLRSTTFIGVCVEFVAAVAWLAELFPNANQRERALGYTQAFSSIGGLLVGGAWLLTGTLARQGALPDIVIPGFLASLVGEISVPNAPWRYTLMSGLVPALPLIIIRPFLPESPIWQQKKEAGTLRRPSFAALFSPALFRTTIITTLMVGLSYGAAFGALQQIPQIVPALPEVRTEIAEAMAEAKDRLDAVADKARAAAEKAVRAEFPADDAAAIEKLNDIAISARSKAEKKLAQDIASVTAGQLQLSQEVGGLLGRFILALLVVRICHRGTLIRMFQIPGLVVLPIVFAVLTIENKVLFTVGAWDLSLLHVGIFAAGLLTVAQFSFWGNYLPMVFPLHLRGTGESIAHNVGGRMLGTSFAAITSMLSGLAPGGDDATRVAYTAAAVAFAVYFLGFVLSFFLPEPREETMHQ